MKLETRTDIDTAWQQTYAELIATPEQAVAKIQPGRRVFIGTACAEPLALVDALAKRGRELADIELVQIGAPEEAQQQGGHHTLFA